jgi:hypothetical protein
LNVLVLSTLSSSLPKLVCLSTRAKIIKQARIRIHGRFNDETQEIAILFSKIDPNTFSEKSPVDGKIDADHDRIETNSSDIPSLALRSPPRKLHKRVRTNSKRKRKRSKICT